MSTIHPSYLVGLAGGSASGKSTLSRALAGALSLPPALSVAVFSTDAYFLPHDRIPRFYSPTRQREMVDYNRPDSLDLPRLLADLETRRADPDPPDVLVLEGLMVLHHPEIRQALDLRVFVELDADQRALRRMVRNLEHGGDPLDGINTPETIAGYFLESAKVGHERWVEPSRAHADLVLRGDGDSARAARFLAAIIRAERNQDSKG
jgi:uridine kinase